KRGDLYYQASASGLLCRGTGPYGMNTGSLSCRILVVDDEPAMRRFLRTSLAAHGYQVIDAQNGTDALALLERNGVDALLLDLGLPDIDGLDVLKNVRAAGLSVPVIVLSSRADETGKVKALDLGADDYV